MPEKTRQYKERRLYFFICEGCGAKNRQSFKRSKTKAGLCRKCLRKLKNQPPEGQESLFSNQKQTYAGVEMTQQCSDRVSKIVEKSKKILVDAMHEFQNELENNL